MLDSGRELLMACAIASNLFRPNQTGSRSLVASFDSGYEHSLDHYVDLKLLLQDDDDREANDLPATFAVAS